MKRGPYKQYLSSKVKPIVSRQTLWSQRQIRRQRNPINDDEIENKNLHAGVFENK